MVGNQHATAFIHGKNAPDTHIPFKFYSETMLNGHIFPSVGVNKYC